MNTTPAFSPFEVVLEGAQLIEASAGTGKTYTIASLFLRLLLERPDLDVRRILVVTFTEAATAELRDRLRNRLHEALAAFRSGTAPAGDAFLQELLTRHAADNATALLSAAIADFDEAAVFTIHGFCQRVLRDMAFEAGGLFDTELISSQDDLVRRAVDDYWRKTSTSHSRLFTAYCIQNKLSADSLYSLVNRHIGRETVVIIPQEQTPDSAAAEQDFLNAVSRVRTLWAACKDEVRELLSGNKNLDGKKYQARYVSSWVAQLDAWLSYACPLPPLFERASRFTSKEIAQAVKKNCQPPQHPFFDEFSAFLQTAQQLAALYQRQALALQYSAFGAVRAELEKRKQAQNIQYFDDLLLRLYRCLIGPEGGRLAAAVRSGYGAALIDEFQDTDPVQYAIFARIFRHPEALLFLIGDPKQAIYSFRSADIFTYLEAAGQAQSRHWLGTNYRSDPQLIRAVNTLFGGHTRPFLFENIAFQQAIPAPGREAQQDGPPFELWHVPQAEHAGLRVAKLRRGIARCTANEIRRLIAEGELPRSIAVLVRTNKEAALVQAELARWRVPCIYQSTETIFDTNEAAELQLVLQAVAMPGHEGHLRAACSTLLLGQSAEALFELLQDSAAHEQRLMRFTAYHDIWQQQGCFAMLRRLIVQEAVLERLVQLPAGERRVTNVLHLAEVLHRQEMQAVPGMEGLVQWLADQRNPDTQRLDEHQLRLESDEDAVKIVTIHKSKGLEYPIVFCPFSWGGQKDAKPPVLFHDPAANQQPRLDIGSAELDAHKALASREALAEDLRLLYVALTRARRRCYLAWVAKKDTATSALAYLLHGADLDPGGDILGQLKERFENLADDDVQAVLSSIEARSGGTIAVRNLLLREPPPLRLVPAAPEPEPLLAPSFTGTISRSWRIASFSSLIAGRPHEQEFRQTDEFTAAAPAVRESAGRTIFTLPAGSRTGTMLHELLEKTDFADPAGDATRRTVSEKLAASGLSAEWSSVVLAMLGDVAAAPLRANGASFSLRDVPAASCLHELEFYFPLKPLAKETLAGFFSEAGQPEFTGAIDELVFSPVAGYMNGFIDLVFCHDSRFYLVDWKSNFLGSAPADYAPEKLGQAMRDNFYFLQYHLYSLALHRYLQLRLPDYDYERHFGGVFYLFLRGMSATEAGSGIYFDRPAFELIRKMNAGLIDK